MIRYYWVWILIMLGNFLQAQSWEQLEDFPGEGRDDGVSITIGDFSYYGTGRNNSFAFLNDWWRYNHPTQTWDTLTPLPGLPRQYAAIASLEDNIYLMGGIGQNNTVFDEVWKYNTSSDQWNLVDHLPSGKRFAPLLVKFGHQLVYGMGNDGDNCYNDLYTYDPELKQWEALTTFPGTSRQQVKAFCTNTALIIGSGRCGGDCHYTWHQLDLKDTTWSSFSPPDMNFCSYQFQADHKNIYITGGGMKHLNDITPNSFSQQWYYFDKIEHHWHSLPNFPATPRRSGATFYHNSTITIVSGLNSNPERTRETWELKLPDTPTKNTHFYYTSKNEKLIIYPQQPLASIKIYQMDGQLLHHQTNFPNSQEIFVPTSGWQKGVYLVYIEGELEVRVERVFVF